MRFDAVRPHAHAGLRSHLTAPTLTGLMLIGVLLGIGCNGDSDGPTALPDAGRDAGMPTPEAGASPNDAGPDPGSDDAGLTPCGEVSGMGRCASGTRVEVCVTQSGSALPGHLGSYDCRDGEVCDDTSGAARCVLTVECESGATECRDADTLKTCVSGTWADSACSARCVASALGASCAPNIPTQALNGTVRYEARQPNQALTDWSAVPSTLPAQHFVVLSYVGEALLDATTTDALGQFSLLGPATPTAEDHLAIVAAGADAAGQLAFAVANAGHAASTVSLREPFGAAPAPSLWSWSTALDTFDSSDVITISESAGSGAARVFENLHKVFTSMEAEYAPDATPSVVVWVSPGTAWTCGACMTSLPVELGGQTFLHQVALDGSAEDQGYWSDAVSAHELGHYVMSAYGYPPAEGGPHYTGEPTNPGLAWSEGWATFFSSFQRASPIYFDKQQSMFFWLDLEARSYPFDDLPWLRPTASAGLDQLIDENEVAAMLYDTYGSIGAPPLLMALADARTRVGPFERGYTVRTWSDPDDPGNFTDSDTSIPYLADFLDALRCSDAISAAELDLVTEPAIHYPYPSASPLCR